MPLLSSLTPKPEASKVAEPRIIVAFHSTGICVSTFALDLARALRYSGTIVPLVLHEQSCYVDSARNKLVRTFLSMPEKDASHLMMIDADLSFPPDAFIKTFHLLEAVQADVLYGNYSLGNSGNSVFGPAENSAREAAVLVNLKPNHIYTDIGTGGTGWLMARRSLLERMQKECPGPWHWFARDPTTAGDDLRGEDVSFGLRMWNMNPRPKVVASTHLLLRHFKQQPFIPAFMSPVATAERVSAMAMPNPYEHDKDNFEVVGNQVVHKRKLTPEEVEKLRKEGKVKDAVERSDEQVSEGKVAQREQEGQEGPFQEASHSDHAEREAEGSGGESGVPAPVDGSS
jgi:hypothetical protein